MITESILRHLLSDDESLFQYLEDDIVTFGDVKRRMFLKERSENKTIPDHHYRLVLNKRFENLHSLGDILRIGMFHMAESFLEFRGERIHVQQGKQNQWQQLITYMPPLIIQAAFLHIKAPLLQMDPSGIIKYYNQYILPNAKYTSLPHPYVPQLEGFINARNGLHDLHVHLNGATETDLIWQDYLTTPEKIYQDLEVAFQNEKVKEQLEQESVFLKPLVFLDLLRAARKIRYILYEFIFPGTIGTKNKYEEYNAKNLLTNVLHRTEINKFYESYKHPFSILVYNDNNSSYLMAVEGLMYILTYNYIASHPDTVVVSLFHFYLLVLGQANRLLVQQTHQHGFEQFQKHTLNGFRESSEKEYRKRFLQMHGNELRHISFIEGRFSPKNEMDETEKLLVAIEKGWLSLKSHVQNELQTKNSDNHRMDNSVENLDEPPHLSLIAHFIKRADKKTDNYIRHKELRIDIWEKANSLTKLIQNHPKYAKIINGIDAAASEFDAPPEVFAPVFRIMRRHGIRHFTYHAGEDFHHILSGLRAIYEAVVFTGLSNGDRIGHATAAGLSAAQWLKALGNEQLIHRGEWLDNLVFTYHLIISMNIEPLKHHLPNVINQLQELASAIYNKHYPNRVLSDAWLLRRFCPILFFKNEKSKARGTMVFDEKEWEDGQNCNASDDAKEAFSFYHNSEYRMKYEEIILIKTADIFNADELQLLQLAVLKCLHQKEIVIETLPTSNVRIGHHPDYSTYHLWNWIKWEAEGHYIPPIVVGTDDTGIFATNIYNEYANIYCHLIGNGNMTHNKAMDVIKKLDENSRIYKFKSQFS